MQRLLDNLIRHMRTVVVAGIDVVHAGINRLAQNSDCGINVTWWSIYFGAGKLHCAVTHAVDSQRCAGQSEAAGEISLLHHCVPPFISSNTSDLCGHCSL